MLVEESLTVKEIAQRLGINPRSIETQLHRMFDKLGEKPASHGGRRTALALANRLWREMIAMINRVE